MKIDNTNYSAYIIDLLDGNLSQQDIDSLLDFLNANPDLKEELEMVKDFKLEPNSIEMMGKSELKKSFVLGGEGSYFDELCIASIENNISDKDREYLNKELKNNPGLQKKYSEYQLLKLTPDESIIFKDKNKLKHPKKFFTPKHLFYTISISVLLLLTGSGIFLLNSNNKLQKTIDEIESSSVVKKQKQIVEDDNDVISENIVTVVEKKENTKNIKPVFRKKEIVEEPNNETIGKEIIEVEKEIKEETVETTVVETEKAIEHKAVVSSAKASLNINLIPNASFEKPIEHTDTSWQKYLKDDSPDYFNFGKKYRSNDVFNKYIGGANPKDGEAYMGIFCFRTSTEKNFKNIREYIKTPLKQNLIKDSTYRFEISICLDEESNVAIKNFGVLFTSKDQEYNKYKLFNSNPQIVFDDTYLNKSTGWTTLSYNYVASGDENYIIVGNFNSDKDTDIQHIEKEGKNKKKEKWKLLKNELAAYYYIDNLILKKEVY